MRMLSAPKLTRLSRKLKDDRFDKLSDQRFDKLSDLAKSRSDLKNAGIELVVSTGSATNVSTALATNQVIEPVKDEMRSLSLSK